MGSESRLDAAHGKYLANSKNQPRRRSSQRPFSSQPKHRKTIKLTASAMRLRCERLTTRAAVQGSPPSVHSRESGRVIEGQFTSVMRDFATVGF